ncbi:MAG: TIGR04002 family protein [Oscillospiraceae bacterium]|jgi:uncharacterized repeat protein (TIGR04002 family)|nr:TIGR04002 family protein [Oscillospiraceae bacterium]
MRKRLYLFIFTGLFAALAAALTFVHLPIPMLNGGYVHLGDSLVYLAACMLPAPYAALAAGIGGGLADLLSGAPAWAPFTVLIKVGMTLFFSSRRGKLLDVRQILGLLPAALLNAGGYYLAEGLMYGSWKAILWPSLTGNLIQSAGSTAVFLALCLALDRAKGKQRLEVYYR